MESISTYSASAECAPEPMGAYTVALVDLAGFLRDALVVGSEAQVPLTHPDRDADVRRAATDRSPESVLRRLEAVLACRTALDQNVKPEIAVEAMMAAMQRG